MSNLEVLGAVHGIAPRSDELHRLGTDLERGRVSREAFDERVSAEQEDWLALQESAGIDIQENGKLFWQDHLRPIVSVSKGFENGIDDAPVTRWFEDNRFYRQPTINGRLAVDFDRFDEQFPDVGKNVSLLSLNSFTSLCIDNFPELPLEQNILQLYADLLLRLEQKGVQRVTFEEYAEGSICARGADHGLKDIETLADRFPNINLAIINPRNTAIAIPWSLEGNLGIQIPATDLPIIEQQPEYQRPDFSGGEIWHQLFDASTTELVHQKAEQSIQILSGLGAGRLIITHNVDLECVPLFYAQEKVKRLGEYVASLKEAEAIR